MDWTFTHVCYTGPVESGIVHCRVAGLELPGLEFLAFSMGSKLHLHCALTELRYWFSLWSVAEFVGFHPPRFSKVIHVKLEVPISTNQVITFMTIVVATKTTELALEMRGSHDLHKTVSIPRYLQTFSADRTASFPVENFTLWAAADRNTLLLSTLCLPLHTSTDAAVD